MKDLFLLMFLAFSFMACEDKTELKTGLEGTYKLSHIYADPGNGSGTYQPVNFNPSKEIVFGVNGSFSNRNFNGQEINSFNYISYELKSDGKLLFKSANGTEASLTYVINGNELTISFMCYEGCGYRFTRL